MPSWLPWSSTSSPSKPSKVSPRANDIADTSDAFVSRLRTQLASLPPPQLAAITLLVGGVTTLGGRYVYARHFRRIPNAEWVNPDMLARKRWIKGYVTRCLPARSVLVR